MNRRRALAAATALTLCATFASGVAAIASTEIPSTTPTSTTTASTTTAPTTTTSTATTSTATTSTTSALTSTASTAPLPDQVRWGGRSIHLATVPARVVEVEAWSSTPARSVELLMNGRVVMTDATVDERSDHWLGTGELDLTGRAGGASVTMRVTSLTGVVRSTTKYFTIAAVQEPEVVPTPPPSEPAPGTGSEPSPGVPPEGGTEPAPVEEPAAPVTDPPSDDPADGELPSAIMLGQAPIAPDLGAGDPTPPLPGTTTPVLPDPTTPVVVPAAPTPEEEVPATPSPPVAPVTPAPDQIRWNGGSIHKQRVVGTVVDLEVWSSTPATMIELLLGGSVVATDTTVEQRVDHWLGTATVDLSGLPEGPTSLVMRVTSPDGSVRSASKTFTVDRVVVPLTAEIVAARPGPDNTGVPVGTTLTPSGPLTITQDGAVVDGLDITGCVVVAANDVTIRNTRIRCEQAPRKRAVVMDGKRTGLLIEDTEIDGGGTTDIGIDLTDATLRRLDIHHVGDGIRMGANLVIEDSWIHHMTRIGSLHPDAIQGISASNIVIRNNTLDPRNPDTGDLANSAIMLGSETGTKISRDVLIEGNYLDGGNYTINVSSSITAENLVVRGNRFGMNARYGAVISRATIPVATDNVVDAWGTQIRVVYTQ
ncbi:right-handed parallel beta-helix repeat-containing protein [Actinotalea ferrariae]|uniref:right-handed parallel beta-helix repeat-containing protein n=1 Tax=Actinotalea ferrariae TaxID=1386098 RepID=UPI001C8BE1F9|nr:right-handed parallel beta-helix repeat-containing protein [Actinotalea ferrariae]MBX9244514.1 right-handed parallel beta-helix repeat-containing protein [Actinotalea ferrariae]